MPAPQTQDVSPTSKGIVEPSTPWKVAAASVRGSSHEKLNMPCQDAHCWALHSDGALLAAVADGAGSAKHSDIGATTAVQQAIETLRAEPDLANRLQSKPSNFNRILNNTLQTSRTAVRNQAKALGVTTRELASTLIITVVTSELIATAQIGDGAAVAYSPNGECIALTTPDSGEYINQTTFLTSRSGIKSAQYHLWDGEATHIALFSDGLQMLALTLPFGKPHTPFFSPLFKFVSASKENTNEQLTSFLSSPRVRERTDDDLTLLLAARMNAPHATHS